MADCGVRKPGLEPCIRKAGHVGADGKPDKHVSFATNSRGFDSPRQWSADSDDDVEEVCGNGERNDDGVRDLIDELKGDKP